MNTVIPLRKSEKITFIGVGNPIRGDDSIGPEFIRRCKELALKYNFINVEEVPENYIKKILDTSCEIIVIVDAIIMGDSPGTIRVFNQDEILLDNFSFTSSTHNISVKIFIEFLINEFKSKNKSCDIYLIGIQPKTLNFNQQMSEEVKEALEKLIDELKNLNRHA